MAWLGGCLRGSMGCDAEILSPYSLYCWMFSEGSFLPAAVLRIIQDLKVDREYVWISNIDNLDGTILFSLSEEDKVAYQIIILTYFWRCPGAKDETRLKCDCGEQKLIRIGQLGPMRFCIGQLHTQFLLGWKPKNSWIWELSLGGNF